jgi:hypothetical protein
VSTSVGKIENIDLLTDIFGRFPSFHDSEVVRLTLDRSKENRTCLEATIRLFETTSAVDDNGYCILKNHVLVDFCFCGIEKLMLGGFNHQNVLWDLYITPHDDSEGNFSNFEVLFEGIFGVHATFECASVRVDYVKPFET